MCAVDRNVFLLGEQLLTKRLLRHREVYFGRVRLVGWISLYKRMNGKCFVLVLNSCFVVFPAFPLTRNPWSLCPVRWWSIRHNWNNCPVQSRYGMCPRLSFNLPMVLHWQSVCLGFSNPTEPSQWWVENGERERERKRMLGRVTLTHIHYINSFLWTHDTRLHTFYTHLHSKAYNGKFVVRLFGLELFK